MKQMEQFIPVEPTNAVERNMVTKNEIQFYLAQQTEGGFDEYINKYAKSLDQFLKDNLERGRDVLQEYRETTEKILNEIAQELRMSFATDVFH